MFGYIIVNKQELKFKEFDMYQSYYCGLCKTLKDKYGTLSRVSLNYDMNFLALLLSGLYEPNTSKSKERCVIHPISKHVTRYNECIDYAAKMTIVLTYFKCQDDWQDEHKYTRLGYQKLLSKHFQDIQAMYPTKVETIIEQLQKIHDIERNNTKNLDEISSCFGKVMAEICTYKEDEWYDELYELGFYLGKFIYLMDAYDDVEQDIKKGTYNPFTDNYLQEDFAEYAKNILEMMLAEATNAFERLPIIEHVEILRNILYSGIWSKYELINAKRIKERSK